MMCVKQFLETITALAVCIFWVGETAAQELTPRLYWPAPQGTKVLVAGYSRASGDVFFDRSVPLYGVDSRINVGILAYLHTLSLWGRTSNFLVELPYTWGNTQGAVEQTAARRDFSDFGDLKFNLTVNLLGAPSMTPEDFLEFRASPRPIVGASLKVVAPTGHYDSNRLINIGANRWATRVQLGSVIPLSTSWLLELEAGVWFFGEDDEFLTGEREQDPIFSGQVNFIKRFKPGLWASLDLTYFAGGRQTIGGERLDDVQRNAKIGGTIVIPFAGRHAVKIGYANGAVTKYGTDFDQFLFTYQYLLR